MSSLCMGDGLQYLLDAARGIAPKARSRYSDRGSLARFLAYEKQNRYFEEVGELFVASDYNYKQLLIALTLSEYYRAVNLDTDDEQVQQAQAPLGCEPTIDT